MAKCSSCGAWVLWAFTPRGKRIPVDARPDPAGKVVLARSDRGVEALFPSAAELAGEIGPRHTAHFATCPNAQHHRKRGDR